MFRVGNLLMEPVAHCNASYRQGEPLVARDWGVKSGGVQQGGAQLGVKQS